MRARLIVPLIACSLLAFLGLRDFRPPPPEQTGQFRSFHGDLLPTTTQVLPGAMLEQKGPLVLELQPLPSADTRLQF